MARKKLSELKTLIDSSLPDNTAGLIGPSHMRGVLSDISSSCNAFNTYQGHVFYMDSADTLNRLSVPQNTNVLATMDKLAINIENLPESYVNANGHGFFDSTNNKVVVDSDTGMYMLRISFSYEAMSPTSTTYLEFRIDNGTTDFDGTYIGGTHQTMEKSSGDQVFMFTFPFFSDPVLLANGLKLIVNTEDSNLEVWNKRILITRMY